LRALGTVGVDRAKHSILAQKRRTHHRPDVVHYYRLRVREPVIGLSVDRQQRDSLVYDSVDHRLADQDLLRLSVRVWRSELRRLGPQLSAVIVAKQHKKAIRGG